MDRLCLYMGYRYSPTIGDLGLSIMIHTDWNHEFIDDDVIWSTRIRGYLTLHG